MPYPFRMPEELRAQVNALAKANSRSVNTELVLLLHEALARRNEGSTDQAIGATAGSVPAAAGAVQIDVDHLADAIAERLAAKLQKM